MGAKLPTESGLKAIFSKHKIKDNGLQKALASYEKLADEAHEECLDAIAQIGKLAASLKKAKEVAANKAVLDFLEDLLDGAGNEEKEVTKAREVKKKGDATAHKKAGKEKEDDDEDEDEDEADAGDYGERLLAAFKKLKGMNGEVMEFVVCDARPFCGLAIGRRVNPKQKEELSKLTGGSKRFLKPGVCFWDGEQFVFELEQTVPGLAKKLVGAVKNFTGKKFRMLVGGESAGGEGDDLDDEEADEEETDEEETDGEETDGEETPLTGVNPELRNPIQPQPSEVPAQPPQAPFSIAGSVGRGGKNAKPDVAAVQTALNQRANAGLKVDGICGPKTIAAITAFQKTLGQAGDGRVDVGRGTARALSGAAPVGVPPAPPRPIAPPVHGKAELGKAPDIWHRTREIIDTNIGELKRAVHVHYAMEHPDLVKQVQQALLKLDGILRALDTKLADSLSVAHGAGDAGARKTELKNSKGILAEYIKFVKSEPLIAHIDSNPFGVETNLKKVLTDALTHMAQAIGQ